MLQPVTSWRYMGGKGKVGPEEGVGRTGQTAQSYLLKVVISGISMARVNNKHLKKCENNEIDFFSHNFNLINQ